MMWRLPAIRKSAGRADSSIVVLTKKEIYNSVLKYFKEENLANLKTTYLGLEIKSPIIAASSRLTQDAAAIKRCEDAGFGAVVMKSLFEEQIDSDSREMIENMEYFSHTDAYDFISHSSKDYYIDTYLETVEKAKTEVDIPVIASVNCKHDGSWIEYAGRFEAVGADALELNIFVVPSDVNRSSSEIEKVYLEILRKVKTQVTIPVALKIGPHFSGMAHFMKRLDDAGADSLVLFNRFYKTDIDINKMSLTSAGMLSVPEETSLPLQWTALMADQLSCDICSNTGIYSGDIVIKHLLAGASAVQICSAALKKGLPVVSEMNSRIQQWMTDKGFTSIEDFRGTLSRIGTDSSDIWERSQYIKAICGIS